MYRCLLCCDRKSFLADCRQSSRDIMSLLHRPIALAATCRLQLDGNRKGFFFPAWLHFHSFQFLCERLKWSDPRCYVTPLFCRAKLIYFPRPILEVTVTVGISCGSRIPATSRQKYCTRFTMPFSVVICESCFKGMHIDAFSTVSKPIIPHLIMVNRRVTIIS